MPVQFSDTMRAAMLAGVAAVAISAPAPALAQAIEFDIPAQGLGPALQQFAVRADTQILFSPELVSSYRTEGVRGSFTPEEALRRLLRGTGLDFQKSGQNVFVLRRNGPQRASAQGPLDEGAAAQTAPEAPAAITPAQVQPGAPTGAIGGFVYDIATGTPVSGAIVRIPGTNLTATTDDSGAYRFPVAPVGEYSIILDYLGSQEQAATVSVARSQTVQQNFTIGAGAADIIVYGGYVSAIQRALNEQRSAANNSTVVSEDFLGGFPAETVSEGLRRVPGVAFGRDEASGEGSRITVRGFSSEAINVQVNGLDLQGTNFERTIDLSGYLAENISKVTIHKSLLPSHEATGSGGLVEIETRSGLDYGDFHFSASVEGERALESGFGDEWQASATIGGKITPRFGIVGTVSYRDTNRRNYDIGFTNEIPPVLPAGYTSVFFVPGSFQFPFDEEFNSSLVTSANYISRDRDETNLLASVNAAWDIGDHTRLRLDAQRNERDAYTYFSRSSIGFLPLRTDMPVEELGGEIRRRTVLNSFRPAFGTQDTDLNLVTNTISLRGDTDVGRWQFRYKAGYSGARSRATRSSVNFAGNTFTNLEDIIDPSTIRFQEDDNAARTPRVVDGGFVEAANGVFIPSLTQEGFDIVFDPANYRILSATRSFTDSPTDAWIGEASVRYTFETWIDYLEAGVKYDRSERTAVDDTFATLFTGNLATAELFSPISGRNTFLSDLTPGLLGRAGLDDIGLGGFGIPFISSDGHASIFDQLGGLLQDNPSTPFDERRFTYQDFRDLDPIADQDAFRPAGSVEERIAGYLEAHFKLGDFDMIGGARLERTRRTGSAIAIPAVTLNLPGFQREPYETFVAAGLVDFVNTVATDTTITPSFLLNYRPVSNVVARLGYFRSTVLPNIQSLRRQTQILIDLRTNFNVVRLREGNPNLKPTTTDNFDFDVAYYFPDSPGLVRAGLFYKNVNNNFTNLLIQDVPASEVRQRVLDYFGDLATSRPDLVAFNDDTEFLISQPRNGEGGTIWGLELEVIRQFNFLPGWLSGFGVIGNLTYTTADFPTLVGGRDEQGNVINVSLDRPLEDQAAWVGNAALTYSRGGFDGRLIYTYQSATVAAYEIHDLNTILPSYSTLDLRMSYNFTGPGGGLYTIFLEGDNLLDDASDPDIRSATSNWFGRSDAEFFFPNGMQFNGGRTFTLGARVRF